MKKLVFVFTGLLIAIGLKAQITFSPAFPKANQEITIIYDATQGTSGLANLPSGSKVYIHAGAILDGPNSTRWQKVVGNWGKDDGVGLMTSLGNNKWQIKLTPTTYFGLAPTDTLYRIGMVFRNQDGTKEGKDPNGLDIFMPIYGDGLFIRIEKPTAFPIIFSNTTSTIPVEAVTSQAAQIVIKVDGSTVKTENNATAIAHTINANTLGKHIVTVEATVSGRTVSQRFSFVVRDPNPASVNLPSNTVDGINYRSSTEVTLALYAPNKSYVYVIGDFNDWEADPAYEMKRTPDGNRYHLDIKGLTPKKEYIFQYLVANPDGSFVRIGDPYADKVSDPWNDRWISPATYPNMLPYPEGKTTGIATVLQTDQTPYVWKNNNFQRPLKRDWIVYELLIRDFTKEHTFQSLIDTLGYLKRLGVNVIHLMPIMEFEGNESWGYNPMYFFAVDKYYGHKNDLKRFIDECHGQGIAVILDMVLNHAFGLNPMVRLYWDAAAGKPSNENPWFNRDPKHDFNVGYDFNHESQATKDFTDRVLKYWLQEYRFDGFRFDLSKGFTQKNTLGNIGEWNKYDQSRINIWNRIHNKIKEYDPNPIMILEHFADWDEEKVLSDNGFVLWGNLNHNAGQAIMGFENSSFASAWNLNRGWNQQGVLAFMESHDEERNMYRAVKFGSFTTTGALNRCKAAAAIFFTIPGPKMMWQFGELGYDYSINTCKDLTEKSTCRTDNKPIRWDYLQSNERRKLYRAYSAIFNLKTRYGAAINTGNYKLDEFYDNGNAKRVTIRHSDIDIVVIANLTTKEQLISPEFTRTGKWYDLMTNDSIMVTNVNQSITFKPGQFHYFTTKAQPQPYNDLSAYRWPDRLPHAPINLRAFTGAQGGIEIRWTDVADNETGFTLERSTQPNTGFTSIASPAANDTAYTDKNVTGGVTYYYRIKSRATTGESGYSAVVSAMLAVPIAPTNLTATASDNEITLSWTDNAPDETGYIVERSESQFAGFTKIADLPANTTTYTDRTAKPKTPMFYRVAATNAVGASAYSNVASAATTSLDEALAAQTRVYPVPATEVLYLELAHPVLGLLSYEILDPAGKVLASSSILKTASTQTEAISVSQLSKGLYVLRLKTESGAQFAKRFAVE